MDKQTLSNYGLLTVVTLILAVMLAFATPFGQYVGDGVVSVANGLVGTSNKSIDEDNISNLEKQWGDKLNNNNGGNEPPAPIVRNGIIPDGAIYTPKGGTAITGNGTNTFPDTPATGDKYEEGDYIYKYNKFLDGNSWYTSESQNGWGVGVKDKTKASYGEIISEIAGQPVNTMPCTFYYCTSLTTAPAIPNSVKYMSQTFRSCTSLTTAPVIPNSVTNMSYTFMECTSLTTAPAIPNSVKYMSSTFFGCTSLTGIIEVNTNPTNYMYCLSGTQITGITGSCSQTTKDRLMATK